MAIASVVQGLIETEGDKVFELDSPKGSTWLESVNSFRYVPTGANKPYTVRQETKKGGDYWYGYRKVVGKLHKKYIGKSSELSTAKLEEIAEALNTPQQPRVTQVTEVKNQQVTDTVTDAVTVEEFTALKSQVQALQESLEALRSELPGKPESLSDSSELLKPDTEVTDSESRIELGNSVSEDIESLKEENESLKRLLDKKSPLTQSDFYLELQKLREHNRELRLKVGEERRSSIIQISDLKRQLEGVTDSELQSELSNRKAENEKLRTDYAALLKSSTVVTNKLREEVQELRSQVEAQKASGDELREELKNSETIRGEVQAELTAVRSELADLKQKSATAGKDLPEAADLLNQLKAKRKKSKADLADLGVILEILES